MDIKALFQGTLTRSAFAWRLLAYGVLMIIIMLLPAMLGGSSSDEFFSNTLTVIIWLLLYAGLIVYQVSLYIRRLRDIGKSPWLVLLGLIPLVNIGLLVYLLFKSSKTQA